MSKKMTTIAIAAIMLASCIASISLVPSEDVDAAIEEGAWGFSESYNGDALIKELYDATADLTGEMAMIHDMLTNEAGTGPITMAELCDALTIFMSMTLPGYNFEAFDFDFEFGSDALTETLTHAGGYRVDSLMSMFGSIMFDLKVTGPFPEDLSEVMGDIDIEGILGEYVPSEGVDIEEIISTIDLDAIIADLVTDGGLDLDKLLDSILNVGGDMPWTLGSDTYPSPDFDINDMIQDIVGGIVFEERTIILEDLRLSMNMIMESNVFLNEDLGITSFESSAKMAVDIDGKTNLVVNEAGIMIDTETVSLDEYVVMNFGSSMLFDYPVPMLPSGTDYWEGTVYTHINSVTNLVTSAPVPMDFCGYDEYNMFMDVDYFGKVLLNEGTVEGVPALYMLYIEGNPMVYSDPRFNAGPLPSSEAAKIRENIEDRQTQTDEIVDRGLMVKFYDGDKVVSETTADYGGTLKMPADPTAPEGKVFIGWKCNGTLWDANNPVLSDLVLDATYADAYTDGEKPTAPSVSGNIFWEIDSVDDLKGEIDKALVDFGNTIYIDVRDESGKLLYSWTMSNTFADLGSSKLIPEIEEKPVPEGIDVGDKNALYLDFKASGVMPSTTTVIYDVSGVFAEGAEIEVLFDDADGLIHTATTIVQNGSIAIPLTHCSSYLLVGDAADGSSDNTMLYIIAAIVVIAIIAVAVVMMRRRSTA